MQKLAGAGVPSANRITLLRGNGGGQATKSVFLKDLNSPFGMALVGNDLYVANTDAIMRFHDPCWPMKAPSRYCDGSAPA